MAKTKVSGWEGRLSGFFVGKLPALPKGLKELAVTLAPWATLISVIVTVPAILVMLGMGGFWSGMMSSGMWRMMSGYWPGYGYGYGVRWGMGFGLASLVAGIVFVLHILSIDGLFKRRATGWRLLFYSCLVQAVYYILAFKLGALLLGTGLSLYILFQIRNAYK